MFCLQIKFSYISDWPELSYITTLCGISGKHKEKNVKSFYDFSEFTIKLYSESQQRW